MTPSTVSARAYLRDFAHVVFYITAAAAFGTGLALVAEVRAAPVAASLSTVEVSNG